MSSVRRVRILRYVSEGGGEYSKMKWDGFPSLCRFHVHVEPDGFCTDSILPKSYEELDWTDCGVNELETKSSSLTFSVGCFYLYATSGTVFFCKDDMYSERLITVPMTMKGSKSGKLEIVVSDLKAATPTVNVRPSAWYKAYRHTCNQFIGSAMQKHANKVTLLGISGDPAANPCTCAEFWTFQEDLAAAYTEGKEPFHNAQVEFTKISPYRTDIDSLEEDLKFFSAGSNYVIVISCPSKLFDQTKSIVLEHNARCKAAHLNAVEIAWATKDDVY
jgi:hypothetical protein